MDIIYSKHFEKFLQNDLCFLNITQIIMYISQKFINNLQQIFIKERIKNNILNG